MSYSDISNRVCVHPYGLLATTSNSSCIITFTFGLRMV